MNSPRRRSLEFEEEEYVDVCSLPLKPPQPLPKLERAKRRPVHPVMWDDSIFGKPTPDQILSTEKDKPAPKEYPHKKRIANLRKLIADGKVKPDPESLIFFLCNKFAVSDDRKGKISV